MLSVVLIWIYIFITAYIVGFGFLNGLIGKFHRITYSKDSYLMAGIAVLTVYAQVFSIFYKVGLLANICLIAICMVISIGLRKQLIKEWCLRDLLTGKGMIMILVFIVLLFAYGTSTGIIHYDTGLYHAQSIRWIEEYGLVKGLGNLHCRLAYNSSAFCLSALYSMSFLGGQSFHCTVGFLALVLFWVCIRDIGKRLKGTIYLSDFAKIAAVYYLLMIFDEMISPASDYFVLLMIFYLIIKWLMLLEKKEESYLPYALLCLFGICIMTVKLSAAFILLLTIKPAWMMFKEKRNKEIVCFVSMGLLTAIPYMIRNILISGWLIYPYTKLDYFDVDWKIPKGMAEYDYREIQVWGRGYTNVLDYHMPVSQWFPDWFMSQSGIDRMFILASLISSVVLVIAFITMIVRRKYQLREWLLVAGTLCISFLFWLVSAPLIRYGCVFVWLTPMITFGFLYQQWRNKKLRNLLFAVLLCLVVLYKGAAFSKEIIISAQSDTIYLQKDYENFETIPYEVDGYTFYYPREGDRTGYKDFPASPSKGGFELRRSKIEDGFKAKERNE